MEKYRDQKKDVNVGNFEARLDLVKNTFYYGITNLGDIFLFALMVLAGRYLGAKDYGIFSFALSLAYIFSIIPNFGLDGLATREIARDRGNASKYIGNILVWQGILSAIAFTGLFFTINFLNPSQTVRKVTYLLGAAALIRSLILSIRSFFQAFERFDLESIIVVIDRLLLFAIASSFLIMHKGVVIISWIFLIVRFFIFFFALGLLNNKIARIPLECDFQFIRKFQSKALPFGFSMLCVTLYTYFDSVLISLMKTEVEVGIYNSAYQIFLGSMVFSTIISAVFYPRLSNLFNSDKKRHLDLFSRGIKYMFLVSFSLSAFGILFSEKIILLLFGIEYRKATLVLTILLIGITFLFQNRLYSVFLNSIDQEKFRVKINFIGLVIRVLIAVILIPPFGILGAAVAAVSSEFSRFIAVSLFIYKKEFRVPLLGFAWKPLCSAILIAIIIWSLKDLSLFFSFSIFFLLYISSLYFIRVFDKYELDVFQGFLTRYVFNRFKFFFPR